MSPEEAVRLRILATSAVTALVSTRVRTLNFRQGETWPAVRVTVVAENVSGHLRGGITRPTPARVQVDSVAETNAAALALADAIRGDGNGTVATGLLGWKGYIGSGRIDTVTQIDRTVGYDSDEQRLVRVREDYEVWYQP